MWVSRDAGKDITKLVAVLSLQVIQQTVSSIVQSQVF